VSSLGQRRCTCNTLALDLDCVVHGRLLRRVIAAAITDATTRARFEHLFEPEAPAA
jgi:hypothetical protein